MKKPKNKKSVGEKVVVAKNNKKKHYHKSGGWKWSGM